VSALSDFDGMSDMSCYLKSRIPHAPRLHGSLS
jgi:hypothetical protein